MSVYSLRCDEPRKPNRRYVSSCQTPPPTAPPTAPLQGRGTPTILLPLTKHPHLPTAPPIDQAPRYRVLKCWSRSVCGKPASSNQFPAIHYFSIYTLISQILDRYLNFFFTFWDIKVWLYLISVCSFHTPSLLFLPSPSPIILNHRPVTYLV